MHTGTLIHKMRLSFFFFFFGSFSLIISNQVEIVFLMSYFLPQTPVLYSWMLLRCLGKTVINHYSHSWNFCQHLSFPICIRTGFALTSAHRWQVETWAGLKVISMHTRAPLLWWEIHGEILFACDTLQVFIIFIKNKVAFTRWICIRGVIIHTWET